MNCTHNVEPRSKVLPFLKWAGGKRWLVSSYRQIFPNSFARYVEPFLGSGAVFFSLAPAQAIVSDANWELINCFRCIERSWRRVQQLLALHQELHDDAYYYQVRSNSSSNQIERAARFIYLNRTCWNGLYRVNKRGEFNVPRGTKNSVLMPSDDFKTVSQRLRGVEIRCCDFEETIDRSRKNDLLFVDPPYTVKHNLNGFVKYNDKIFSWEDQVRLRDALLRAKRRGVQIVMTNANHHSVAELYESFEQEPLSRFSVLSGSSLGRGLTQELLIRN